MSSWVCQWNPSGSLLVSRFRRPTWRNVFTWVMILPTNKVWRIILRLCRVPVTKVTSPNQCYLKKHLQHLDQRSSLMLFPWNLLGPRALFPSGKELRHHCLAYDQGAILSTQINQLSPFPERLMLPFSSLLGHRPVHRVVKTDTHATLVRHMVDVQNATEYFREASERRHDTSSQTNRFNKSFSNRSSTTGIQGPRRGKEDAFEKQIAGRWHVITLQEASEYVDHYILTSRFHVTHYGGCAILFNKDTFYPNIDVKSIYLHDTRRDLPDRVMEGDQGWAMQGVLSRASFHRPPLSGQRSLRYCQEAHPHDPCYHDWSTN